MRKTSIFLVKVLNKEYYTIYVSSYHKTLKGALKEAAFLTASEFNHEVFDEDNGEFYSNKYEITVVEEELKV